MTKALDKYRLNEAAKEIYEFIWNKFADVYIEKVKLPFDKELNKITVREESIPVLHKVLEDSLKLLHPFMPFITEEIYQKMLVLSEVEGSGHGASLMVEQWPAVK